MTGVRTPSAYTLLIKKNNSDIFYFYFPGAWTGSLNCVSTIGISSASRVVISSVVNTWVIMDRWSMCSAYYNGNGHSLEIPRSIVLWRIMEWHTLDLMYQSSQTSTDIWTYKFIWKHFPYQSECTFRILMHTTKLTSQNTFAFCIVSSQHVLPTERHLTYSSNYRQSFAQNPSLGNSVSFQNKTPAHSMWLPGFIFHPRT